MKLWCNIIIMVCLTTSKPICLKLTGTSDIVMKMRKTILVNYGLINYNWLKYPGKVNLPPPHFDV